MLVQLQLNTVAIGLKKMLHTKNCNTFNADCRIYVNIFNRKIFHKVTEPWIMYPQGYALSIVFIAVVIKFCKCIPESSYEHAPILTPKMIFNISHGRKCYKYYYINIRVEESYLLGYNSVQSTESQPTFQRNMLPPSSGSKNEQSKKPAWSR
jgi:hypothetical protein